jgi:hypothetical protein
MTPIEPNQTLSITLTAQDWNTVLAALNEMPHRIAAPLISSIMQQAQAGLEPKPDGATIREMQPMAAD